MMKRRNFLALFILAPTLLFAASNGVMEKDRSALDITGVIGSSMSLWADLNYTSEYAFYLNDGIDNEKAEYLVKSSDHGYQIGTWGMVTNFANTTVTITHNKLVPVSDSSYSGIEYKLYVDYPDPDDADTTNRTYCYSSEGSNSQKSFSETYNTSTALTSFKKMGLYVQLDLSDLSELDDNSAPVGEYSSTITLSAMAD